MKASFALSLLLSALPLVASVPVGLEDELEHRVLAMGTACAAMEGAKNHRESKWGRFRDKCATCKASCDTAPNGMYCERYHGEAAGSRFFALGLPRLALPVLPLIRQS